VTSRTSGLAVIDFGLERLSVEMCEVYLRKGKGKAGIAAYGHHLTDTECHLPYGITQCHLPPDTSEHTPPSPQPMRPVLDLPSPEGWKAELT